MSSMWPAWAHHASNLLTDPLLAVPVASHTTNKRLAHLLPHSNCVRLAGLEQGAIMHVFSARHLPLCAPAVTDLQTGSRAPLPT